MAYENLSLGGSSNTSDKIIIVGNDYLVKFDGSDYKSLVQGGYLNQMPKPSM